MMILLLVTGLMAATWRLTRLLVRDEFPPARTLREWVIATFGVVDEQGHIVAGRRLGGIGHAVAYLWTCPWCMSIWVSAGLVAAADWRGSVPLPWLVGALAAAFTGVMAMVENEHEQRFELRQIEIRKEKR
jgi:hypothetical protein